MTSGLAVVFYLDGLGGTFNKTGSRVTALVTPFPPQVNDLECLGLSFLPPPIILHSWINTLAARPIPSLRPFDALGNFL